MPVTLAQAKEMSDNKLTKKIIDEFRGSKLLDMLPFDNTVKAQGGKSMTYSYNRITTQPQAGTRAINAEYTAQETATTRESVDLKILGGAFELDRVLSENEREIAEHIIFQAAQKAKATIAVFHDLFINGDSAVNTEEFDGLDKILTGSTTEVDPGTAIDLSDASKIEANYKQFLYSLRQMRKNMNGEPDLFLMNDDMYAVFQTVADFIPQIKYTKPETGDEIYSYGNAIFMNMGDKAGTTNPIIETDATNGTTDLYAIRLDIKEGVHGVSPEGNRVVKHFLPDFTTAGAVKKGEVELVAAIAVEATKAAAVLRKIKVQA